MAKQVFAFAEFTFDAETGTLTRKKRSAHLPEQTALLLEVLLENANQLVSRDELRQVLWPDEEFLDYTQGINVAVNRLRNILRDDPRNPRFLKTIPKRGYSFCGGVTVIPRAARPDSPLETVLPVAHLPDPSLPVAESPPASVPEPSAAEEPPFVPPPATYILEPAKPPQASWRKWTWVALLIAVAATIAVVAILRMKPAPPAASGLSLGIAPIHVHGDPQDSEVSESFRLELSDALSKLPRVQVHAASTFMSSDAAEVSRISRTQNLDDMLLGSMVRQGDQYDLKFELVRAADAVHLASFEYSGAKKDLPALCERLQRDIFHYLQSNTTTLQTLKGSTNDSQAYELYLQGAYQMYERDPDSLKHAVADFQQATQRDQNFAAAYASIATAYLKLSAYDTNPNGGLLSKAEDAAQRAIHLNPSLAQAHAVLGCVAYKQDHNFSRGEAELRDAIQIDPTQAEYRNWLAVLLADEGRFNEALDQLHYAQTNSPFLPSVYAMQGLVGIDARQNSVATDAAKKYVDLLPNLPIAHNTLAWVYFETGHYEDAVREWRYMAQLQNDQARIELEDKGMNVLKAKGIRAYAQLKLDAIHNHRGVNQVNDFSPAEWYACAGNRDQALLELERLTASRDPYMLHVAVDPLYDGFHKDPKFLALVAKAGLTVPASLENINSHLCESSSKSGSKIQ
jgi:DNA-binding winged helix-turn-helix (wHTH) protein/Flp pilus assembly protein TadD/TolB-like protein